MSNTIKRSFNLPNGKSVFGNDIGCKGNGIGIAYTDGTNNSTINLATSGNAGSVFMMATASVGSAVGTSTSRRTDTLKTTVLGITTDSTKSGIILDTRGGLNAVIKY